MAERLMSFAFGVAFALAVTGAGVALCDGRRNAARDQSDAEWSRLVQASYDRGYEAGRTVGALLAAECSPSGLRFPPSALPLQE